MFLDFVLVVTHLLTFNLTLSNSIIVFASILPSLGLIFQIKTMCIASPLVSQHVVFFQGVHIILHA